MPTVIRSFYSLIVGAYYHYVNYSKQERFAIDALGGDVKFTAIGRTLAARAFELMILRPLPDEPRPAYRLCGRWHGDRVAVERDDGNPDWDTFSTFTNIGADVAVMLYEVDGFEPLAVAASRDEAFYVQLVYLVVTHQVPALSRDVEQRFGADYRKQYEALVARIWNQPQNLALREV